MTTLVASDCGKRLCELFDAIVIVVNEVSVTIVHGYGFPATVQEVRVEKLVVIMPIKIKQESIILQKKKDQK